MSTTLNKVESYIKDMLIVQAELNAKTNGENYISSEPRTNKGKFIYYPICMKMEASELLDSLPWKHWKYKETEYDIPNIKIELIDILHFALSVHLDHFARMIQPDSNLLADKTVNEYAKELVDYLASAKPNNVQYKNTLFEYLASNVDINLKNDFENMKDKGMEPYIGFMHYTDRLMQFKVIPNVSCIRELYEIILTMYGLTKMIENNPSEPITLDSYVGEIYNLYKAKLALNELRQDYGYNSGEYIKMWNINGVVSEDNQYIHNLISNNKIYVTGFNYYKLLKAEYEQQIKIQGQNNDKIESNEQRVNGSDQG